METKEIVTDLLDRVVRLSVELDREKAACRSLLIEKEGRERAPYIAPSFGVDLIVAMANDRKIEAIKAYRSITGQGLKESKDAIETVMNKMRAA